MSQPTSRLKYSYGRNVITLWKMPTTINMNTAERSLKEKFLIVKEKEEAFFFFNLYHACFKQDHRSGSCTHPLSLDPRVSGSAQKFKRTITLAFGRKPGHPSLLKYFNPPCNLTPSFVCTRQTPIQSKASLKILCGDPRLEDNYRQFTESISIYANVGK